MTMYQFLMVMAHMDREARERSALHVGWLLWDLIHRHYSGPEGHRLIQYGEVMPTLLGMPLVKDDDLDYSHLWKLVPLTPEDGERS